MPVAKAFVPTVVGGAPQKMISFKFVQPVNAFAPTLVTPLVMTTRVRLVLPANAESAIWVTVFPPMFWGIERNVPLPV